MRCWLACAALTLAACGRLGYEGLSEAGEDSGPGPNPDFTRTDAATEKPDAPDSAPDAALGPFGEATSLVELSDPLAVDDDPSLTADLLELYFKSDRGSPGDFDIWRARRGSVDEPWEPAERVDELSTTSYEATPEVSYDGLVLYLASSRPGGQGGSDIWISTRASRVEAWSEPVPVPELSSPRDEWAAVTDASATSVVITRSVPGNGLDLFGAARARAGDPWGAPAPLAGLATGVYEADAHLDGSGLRVTFAGELDGGAGRDIYQARRPSTGADFGPPVRLVELCSDSRDEDPWVSQDGRLVVLSSDRTGDQELYSSLR
jgi:hypothetical protein